MGMIKNKNSVFTYHVGSRQNPACLDTKTIGKMGIHTRQEQLEAVCGVRPLCSELAVVCLEVQLNTMSSFMLVPSKYKVARVTANCVQLQLRQLEKAVGALVLADDAHWCHLSKAQVSHCLQITSSTAWVAA